MSVGRWFIGCACDRNFVFPTAVMLSSLAKNGKVPEATILVAAFDFEHEDYGMIRSHAGRLADNIRFIDVKPETISELIGHEWSSHYPPAIFGRLFVPALIEEKKARILTLDSDMIVNASVRPLFELSLTEGFMAAIHDSPKINNPNYFNSGLMLIDVDEFKHFDIARRCLEWIGANGQAIWPDQDALNAIVGHRWHRLERTWNWAYCGKGVDDGPLKASDYANAKIAHFTTKGKPWLNPNHVGRGLYVRYIHEFESRRASYKAARLHVDDNFVATAIEVLLGRLPSDGEEIRAYKRDTSFATLSAIALSSEFVMGTLFSVLTGDKLPQGRFPGVPSVRHRRWAAQRLPLHNDTLDKVETSGTWNELLGLILADRPFRTRTGLTPVMELSEKVLDRRRGR